MCCDDGVSRAISNLFKSQKRFQNSVEFKGGYKGVEWVAPLEGMEQGTNPLAVVWDRDCPANSVYFINFEDLVEYVMSDWDWMDLDGSTLSRVANTDAYEAVMFKYHEVAAYARNSHGLLADITSA